MIFSIIVNIFVAQNKGLKDSKLAQIISALSPKEQKELKSYLRIPMFSNRTLVGECFDYVLIHRKKRREWPSKAAIHQQFFPKKNYKDEQVRLLMSQLLKAIEDYWVHKAQRQQSVQRGLTLAQVYRSRKLDKAFQQNLKTSLQQLEKRGDRSDTFFFEMYQTKLEWYSHRTAISRADEQELQAISDALDKGFIIAKLRQACRMLAQQAVAKQQYDFGLLEASVQYLESNNLLKEPAVRIYYHSYRALCMKEEQRHFRAFKDCLFEFETHFPPKELRDLYLLGVNCCIKIINTGQHDFLHEILALYKRGLVNEALLENGVLSHFTCQNIVTTGLHTNDYEWTHWFLENYKDKIEREYKESTYRFNLGRLFYSEQKYDEALELLRDINHKDLLLNLFSKTLLLKIYYEQQKFQLLEPFLDAFAIYLRRKKVIGYHRTNYKNIIAYTKKLTSINPFDKTEKAALQQQIEAEEILSERAWLLDQLKEI